MRERQVLQRAQLARMDGSRWPHGSQERRGPFPRSSAAGRLKQARSGSEHGEGRVPEPESAPGCPAVNVGRSTPASGAPPSAARTSLPQSVLVASASPWPCVHVLGICDLLGLRGPLPTSAHKARVHGQDVFASQVHPHLHPLCRGETEAAGALRRPRWGGAPGSPWLPASPVPSPTALPSLLIRGRI